LNVSAGKDQKAKKVNCKVYQHDNGKRLVFTLDGTTDCIGEIHIAADERYLRVISSLFSQWVDMVRGRAPLPASIRDIINGVHHG
jgi:hypothetical protein